MVLDELPQVRQQVEVRVRRVGGSGQKVRRQPAMPVAFAKELPDECVRTVGLVLVDEGRGLVEVLRHPVFVHVEDRAAGKVGRIARSRCAAAGGTDRECSVAAFPEEVEAVVEILPKGREQGAGLAAFGARPASCAPSASLIARGSRPAKIGLIARLPF